MSQVSCYIGTQLVDLGPEGGFIRDLNWPRPHLSSQASLTRDGYYADSTVASMGFRIVYNLVFHLWSKGLSHKLWRPPEVTVRQLMGSRAGWVGLWM